MELVDAPHSKCGTFGFVGSSPTAPISLMNTYKRVDLIIKRGKGCWVWDQNNKKYLDAVAGIATCSLGHSNTKIRKALTSQLKKIQHVSNLYRIEEQERLAELLTQKSCFDSVFFCNSGAEANEAAIKLIRKHSNERQSGRGGVILSAKSSFHGRTLATVSATGQPKYHKGFEPLVQGIDFFEFNNIDSFNSVLKTNTEKGNQIAGVLIEPLQGEGGVIPGDKKFFEVIRSICNENNSLLIFDEVQTGMGRTGNLWGYENIGVEPDGMTIAKGLGSGHAIGAFLVKKNADIFKHGDHASTFGGNPFACKAGLTVLEEIATKKFLSNVQERGKQLQQGLLEIEGLFPDLIKEVRGQGLIQGLVLNEQNELSAQKVVEIAIKEGLLVVPAGNNVIRMVPPLTISQKEIKYIINRLINTLQKI